MSKVKAKLVEFLNTLLVLYPVSNADANGKHPRNDKMSLLDFPLEILQQVLSYDNLTALDKRNIRRTCTRLRDLVVAESFRDFELTFFVSCERDNSGKGSIGRPRLYVQRIWQILLTNFRQHRHLIRFLKINFKEAKTERVGRRPGQNSLKNEYLEVSRDQFLSLWEGCVSMESVIFEARRQIKFDYYLALEVLQLCTMHMPRLRHLQLSCTPGPFDLGSYLEQLRKREEEIGEMQLARLHSLSISLYGLSKNDTQNSEIVQTLYWTVRRSTERVALFRLTMEVLDSKDILEPGRKMSNIESCYNNEQILGGEVRFPNAHSVELGVIGRIPHYERFLRVDPLKVRGLALRFWTKNSEINVKESVDVNKFRNIKFLELFYSSRRKTNNDFRRLVEETFIALPNLSTISVKLDWFDYVFDPAAPYGYSYDARQFGDNPNYVGEGYPRLRWGTQRIDYISKFDTDLGYVKPKRTYVHVDWGSWSLGFNRIIMKNPDTGGNTLIISPRDIDEYF